MTLARTILVVATTALLAACGQVRIERPRDGQPNVVQYVDFDAAFTANNRWKLIKATLGTTDVTDKFSPQEGAANQLSTATLRPPSFAQTATLTIEARVGPAGGPFGWTKSTATATFPLQPRRVDLILPTFEPAEAQPLYATPFVVTASPNFPWHELRARRIRSGDDLERQAGSAFSPNEGAPSAPSTGTFTGLVNGFYELEVKVKDEHDYPRSASTVFRIANGTAPLCALPDQCLAPDGVRYVPSGTQATHICGRGVWRYTDDTQRDACKVFGGGRTAPTGTYATRCPGGGLRRWVSGRRTCLSGAITTVPPRLSVQIPDPEPGACMHECEAPDADGDGKPDNPSCPSGHKRVKSTLNAPWCDCAPC